MTREHLEYLKQKQLVRTAEIERKQRKGQRMSSKAYQEASKKETDKCGIAITNLYMAGINHDGHSWNTFGDIEDCLAVVIEEMYMQGAKDFAEWLCKGVIPQDNPHITYSAREMLNDGSSYEVEADELIAEWQKGAE